MNLTSYWALTKNIIKNVNSPFGDKKVLKEGHFEQFSKNVGSKYFGIPIFQVHFNMLFIWVYQTWIFEGGNYSHLWVILSHFPSKTEKNQIIPWFQIGMFNFSQ